MMSDRCLHQRALRLAAPSHKERGFTLIEMMLVVAIVAVLAGIAYPNYLEYTTKSRRSDATSMLMQIAAKQEKYFLDNRAYASDLTNLGYANTGTALDPVVSENEYYEIVINRPNAYNFDLTAEPQNTQVGDKKCAKIMLDNEGTKSAEDDSAADTTDTCW